MGSCAACLRLEAARERRVARVRAARAPGPEPAGVRAERRVQPQTSGRPRAETLTGTITNTPEYELERGETSSDRTIQC